MKIIFYLGQFLIFIYQQIEVLLSSHFKVCVCVCVCACVSVCAHACLCVHMHVCVVVLNAKSTITFLNL